MLSSKERVFITLDHKVPDRVPMQVESVPQLVEKFAKRYGLEAQDLYAFLGCDLLISPFGISTGFYKENSDRYINEYGITYRNIGLYTEIDRHPLHTDEKVWSYKPPKIDLNDIAARTNAMLAKYGKYV